MSTCADTYVRARIVLGGIKAVHMIRKGRCLPPKERRASPAEKFYALAV